MQKNTTEFTLFNKYEFVPSFKETCKGVSPAGPGKSTLHSVSANSSTILRSLSFTARVSGV